MLKKKILETYYTTDYILNVTYISYSVKSSL